MLSTTGEYALRAVLYLAQRSNGKPTPANVVADALSLPRNYLSKTLNRLAKDGILESQRGPRGGFRLARSPAAIEVRAIVGSSEERDSLQCLLAGRPCDVAQPCAAHHYWVAWTNAETATMQGTTVADLLHANGS
ncbi:MAG: RrF2 family transcriptional regulator [Longimicrobiales bacterium]